jgi:anti-sigma regulatory factor (Ser/Thr protein kinase)
LSVDAAARGSDREFRHDALLYAGDDGFLAGTLPFIRAAVAAGEPVLVAVEGEKIRLLKSALAAEADHVQFADMREIGCNPARIIPVWRQFVDARTVSGKRAWGIGEPIWAGRSDAELVECHRHESLLNLAFDEAEPLSLLCLYDTGALDTDVIAGALRSHPTVVHDGRRRPNHSYCGLAAAAAPFAEPLPEPPAPVHELAFGAADLADIRHFVARRAVAAGLGEAKGEDIVLAVNELATNSLRHGGGRGTLRVWQERDVLMCEVTDRGRLDDPLAGRRRPRSAQIGGYGLWLANQVCDLVQLRSYADGCAVRVHMRVH